MTPPTQSLETSTHTLLTLLAHSRALLSTGGLVPVPAPTSPTTSPPNPLAILSDIGALTRAHTTKLSIALRPPTIIHAAAARILQDITHTVIPSLLSALELMSPAEHSATLYAAALRAADNALAALEEYAKEIPAMCSDRGGGGGGGGGAGRDRLASTGVVWAAADALMALKEKGAAGAVKDVVDAQKAMLKDAAAELKEWLETNDDDDDAETDTSPENQNGDADAFWDAPKKGLSTDDTETREKAGTSVKKMKLTTILITAVAKRRLMGDGKVHDPQRLDRIAELAKGLASSGDDIGMGYYEDDADEASEAHNNLVKKAIEMADLAALANGGGEDSLSKWFRDFRDVISKNG